MKFFLCVLSLFTALSPALTLATPIVADLRCEHSGGGVAIQLPKAGSNGRVWQTELNDNEGLELEVTHFNVLGDSFYFEAILEKQVKVGGEFKNKKLKYSLFNPDTNKWETILKQIPCSRLNRF